VFGSIGAQTLTTERWGEHRALDCCGPMATIYKRDAPETQQENEFTFGEDLVSGGLV
jgi:hypothetical protein